MASSFIQAVTVVGLGTNVVFTTPFTSPITTGSNIVVFAVCRSTNSTTSVTDDLGNLYVLDAATNFTIANDYTIRVFKADNVTGGTPTITLHNTGFAFMVPSFMEYSNGTMVIDKILGTRTTSSVNAYNVGTVTTSDPDEIIITCPVVDNASILTVFSPGVGYTFESQFFDGTSGTASGVEDMLVAIVGNYDGDYSFAGLALGTGGILVTYDLDGAPPPPAGVSTIMVMMG